MVLALQVESVVPEIRIKPICLLGYARCEENAKKLNERKSEIRSLPYRMIYAWILKNASRLKRPRPDEHLSGAVIRVRL